MITAVNNGARNETRIRPPGLPEFKNPPIDEVAIGLQFKSVGAVHSQILSLYREEIKTDFPNTEYQPRLPTTSIVNAQLPFPGMVGAPPIPLQTTNQEGSDRVWLVARDNSKIVQLQDDRFIVNWRHLSEPYPRFEFVASLFWTQFDRFRDAVSACGGVIESQQLELSYFNWINADELSQVEAIRSAEGSRVESPNHSLRFDGQISLSNFTMLDGDVPIARLLVQAAGEGFRIARASNSLQRGSSLNFSYYSALAPGADDKAIDDQLFTARALIVGAFDQLTTTKAHEVWQKQ